MISFGIFELVVFTAFVLVWLFLYFATTEKENKSTKDIFFKSLAINYGFQKGVKSVELQKESFNNK